jgi:beta-lactam-binding protein with PASTA domain
MARRVPADFEDALAASPSARERFWALPPEQKDAWVAWVERGRLPGARRRRLRTAVRRFGGPPRRVETAVATNGGPPLPREGAAGWLLGLAVLAGLAAFLVWYTTFRDEGGSSQPSAVVIAAKATVPKVVGLRSQAAQFQLREAKLASKLVRRPAKKPKGIVVGQKPKAASRVPQGAVVTLAVSNGPPGVAMPDVVGLAAGDAVRALRTRKLATTIQQVSAQASPGTVVAQSPKQGKRAKPGTKVVLQVAKGEVAVAVPGVTGQSQRQASAALGAAGLTARLAGVPSAQPAGTVVAQSPAAGSKLPKGSVVRLNVARGSQQTTTQQQATTQEQTTTQRQTTTSAAASPQSGNDYSGMRLATAVERIAEGRQQVIVSYVASSRPAGVVVASSQAGSRERLQVSSGPSARAQRAVPDVLDSDAATALQQLQGAGFSVQQVQWPVSDQALDGTVVHQTPAGGQQAPTGATIVIYVGTANA